MSDISSGDLMSFANAIKSENGNLGNGSLWILFILFFLIGGGNFGNWGNNNGVQESLTRAEVQDVVTNQSTQNMISNGFASINQNLCSGFAGINQNVNAGFANNALALNQGFNSVNGNISSLASQMASCCCDIKTTLHQEGEATRSLIQQNEIQSLRDKLQDAKNENLATGLVAANVTQTNNIENFIRSVLNTCSC